MYFFFRQGGMQTPKSYLQFETEKGLNKFSILRSSDAKFS